MLFTIIFVAFAQVCWGQVKYFYKSKGSGDWNTSGSNGVWSSCATLGGTYTDAAIAPSSTNNVTIQATHSITLASLSSVDTLTIESGGVLDANSRSLNVYGDFINNGSFSYGTSTVTMRGVVLQNIKGSVVPNFYNLFISNTGTSGVKASISFNVYNEMRLSGIFNPDPLVLINNNITSDISTLTCFTSGVTVNVTHFGEVLGDYHKQYNFRSYPTIPIEFIGIAAQVIDPISFSNLVIKNSYGCVVGSTGSASITCYDLNIANGVFTVPPGSTLTVLGHTALNSDACLVLKSDSVKTGSFIYPDMNSFSGPGTVKVERFMSHNNLWHLYSSPIGFISTDLADSLSIHDFLKYNSEIPDILNTSTGKTEVGMRKYSTANDVWGGNLIYGETLGEKMSSGRGFSIRTIFNGQDPITHQNITGTGRINAIGIPNDNNVSYSLNKNSNRWNLIGNPFTCSLDAGIFLSVNSPLLELSYTGLYLWDSLNEEYTTDITDVQLGQGFFVKSRIVGGNIAFNADMQSPRPSAPFKGAVVNWPSIKITVTNQTLKSSTKIKFVTTTTKGLDPGYDTGMLKANPDFSLYSRLLEDNGIDFCLQSLPDQDYDQYVIPIGIDYKAGGEITFTAESVNLPSGCQALLEDRLTKRFTRLDLKDAKYTATVSADTKGTGRFFLHTSDVISGDQPIEKQQFKINTIGKTVYINGEVSEKANFFVYSVTGKLLANFKAESLVQNKFDASRFPAGVYILTVDDQNQKKSVKFVIEN